MPEFSTHLAFALIALGMVLTPGPNMIYLVSRSISQGRLAGLISLGGVALGFVVYMLCAAFGITAIVIAIPYAYDVLRFGGALYLLYLAWQAVRPNGSSPFAVKTLPKDSPRKLFLMGFLTTPRSRSSISRCCRNSSILSTAAFYCSPSFSGRPRLPSASRSIRSSP